MNHFSTDTIVAQATAPLAAGVAVIRLSGRHAKPEALHLTTLKDLTPRHMHMAQLYDPLDGAALDKAMMVFFPNPHSFTGEDVVEIHCHGGQNVVESVLKALTSRPTVRMAEAGEFTKRAVINGKMDLTEAEGLADLIAANTDEQRKQALRQMDGELGQHFDHWRESIMHLLAEVEAGIDFPDEELEIIAEAALQPKIEQLLSAFNTATANNVGERLRHGFSAVIVGKPNAGKSTLTNLLTGRETAIVSDIPGTTRDVVETHMVLGGFPLILADTAGLRETDDAIEQEGVRRAQDRAEKADLTIMVADANDWPHLDPIATSALQPNAGLIILSKIDEISKQKRDHLPDEISIEEVAYPVLTVNFKDTATAADLLQALDAHAKGIIRNRFAATQNAAQINRARHRKAIETASMHLQQALSLYQNPPAGSVAELLAQDLRDAAAAIGSVTGRTTNDDVMDLVFSSFCIGK